MGFDDLHDGGVEVAQIGEKVLVEGLEQADGDLALEEEARGDHHVIARRAGEKARLDDLVGIEDVVIGGDAGFSGEFFQRVLGDVVGPVVDIDGLVLRCGRRGHENGGKREENERLMHVTGVPFQVQKEMVTVSCEPSELPLGGVNHTALPSPLHQSSTRIKPRARTRPLGIKRSKSALQASAFSEKRNCCHRRFMVPKFCMRATEGST